jgi:hypothetical protein
MCCAVPCRAVLWFVQQAGAHGAEGVGQEAEGRAEAHADAGVAGRVAGSHRRKDAGAEGGEAGSLRNLFYKVGTSCSFFHSEHLLKNKNKAAAETPSKCSTGTALHGMCNAKAVLGRNARAHPKHTSAFGAEMCGVGGPISDASTGRANAL